MNAQMLSDRELLNDYLQGNKSAISTLIEKYNRRVRDYIRMMVGDADVAADIAQEKKKAINDAKDEIAGISLAIAGKVVGRELTADDQKALIDSFIDELGDQV